MEWRDGTICAAAQVRVDPGAVAWGAGYFAAPASTVVIAVVFTISATDE